MTSGKHTQTGILLRQERDGQIAAWTAAAQRAGLTLSAWIRKALDRAAVRRDLRKAKGR